MAFTRQNKLHPPTAPTGGGSETLEGEITKVIPFDSGYAIVFIANKKYEASLVGDLAMLKEGMSIRATCTRTNHAKYGVQFKVLELEESQFGTEEAIISYLSSNAFKGIGISFARQVVSHFGLGTLEALDAQPEAVFAIPGVSEAKAQALVECWSSERALHSAMTELMALGLSLNQAMKANRHFGGGAATIIQQFPYRLTEISGIGFKRADEVALKMGTPRKSKERIISAIKYVLEDSSRSGHCYLTIQQLVEGINGKDDGVVGLLRPDVSGIEVQSAVKEIAGAGGGAGVRYEKGRVYLASLYNYEQFCAKKLQKMMVGRQNIIYPNIEALRKELYDLGVTNEFTLAPEQEEALMNAMNARVAVITGGPGSGKSTITRALCQLMDAHHIKYKLCSPTGKAAKRLTECVGGTLIATEENPNPNPDRMAKTIHRLLEYIPGEGGFNFNLNCPLETDAVIADESSMIDIRLFYDLVSALNDDDRLVLVGDANQLPSVGPGNVLRDVIASGAVPTVKLQRVFRQAQGSFINEVAHDILNGKVPIIPEPRTGMKQGKNCLFVGATDIDELKEHVITMVSKHLPKIGYKPHEIQVLTPMREKGLGINDLNPILQGALNPPDPSKTEFNAGLGRLFRVGDRVMQTRNNYDKSIFNGEQGEIVGIDRASEPVTVGVKFPDIEKPVIYEQSELDELLHAYAVTIHRSQGSEFPVALVLVHPCHSIMLQRNLLYTGLTRAKKLCVVMGTDGAVKRAVDNASEAARNTTLKELLQADSSS